VTHNERYSLAMRLAEDFWKEHGDRCICCCLYGSTSRGEDTRWSDIELFAITREKVSPSFLLVDTVPSSINTMTESHLLDILLNPGERWPFYAGLVKGLEVLFGDTSVPERYYAAAIEVPYESFRKALKESISELVFESWGRILSCIARKKHEDIYCAVIETLLEMRTALCLLNARHVNRDYFEGIRETFGFERIPERYAFLATRLWKSRDPFGIARDARELMANYRSLLRKEGLL